MALLGTKYSFRICASTLRGKRRETLGHQLELSFFESRICSPDVRLPHLNRFRGTPALRNCPLVRYILGAKLILGFTSGNQKIVIPNKKRVTIRNTEFTNFGFQLETGGTFFARDFRLR